jgi:hypothetical protein
VSVLDFNDLKEKIKKIEERVYSHDEKFSEHQAVIDTTICNLKMQLMPLGENPQADSKFTSFIC